MADLLSSLKEYGPVWVLVGILLGILIIIFKEIILEKRERMERDEKIKNYFLEREDKMKSEFISYMKTEAEKNRQALEKNTELLRESLQIIRANTEAYERNTRVYRALMSIMRQAHEKYKTQAAPK